MKVLVVGAGLSGATIANLLSEDNEVTIVESSSMIGGNCHDHRDKNGIMVHSYGSHIFHTSDQDVWAHLSKFTSFNGYRHKVLANIDGRDVPIPFNFNSIRMIFSNDSAEDIIDRLLKKYQYGSRIPVTELSEQNDEVLDHLFDYIYDKVFLHYTEKQWGASPEDIPREVLSRVPISIDDDGRYFRDDYEGIPVDGYTAMIERMIESENIILRLNTSFKDIGNPDAYDRIFYTGSVDELLDYEYGILPYRSVRFDIEELKMEHYQENSVINYPNDHDYTRIHEYKYYLGDESDMTVIAREYPEQFVPGKNRRMYPIRTDENVALYERYIAEAKKRYPNMYFSGRLGDYKYYDMDKAVARAFEVYREAMQ